MLHPELMQSLSSVGLLRGVEGLHRPQQPEYDLPPEPATRADTDDSDDDDNGNDNGAAVPMTPSDAATLAGDDDSAMGYSPTSPSSNVHMHQLSRMKDDDVEAAAHVCEADEIL